MPIDVQERLCYNIVTVKERSVEYAADALRFNSISALGSHGHSEQP